MKKKIRITLEVEIPEYNESAQCKNFCIPKREYWHCLIGPVERCELPPDGADSPLRQAVKDAFYKVVGWHEDICLSGWGQSMEEHDAAAIIQHKLAARYYKEQNRKAKK